MHTNYTVLSLLFKYYGLEEQAKGSNSTILSWIKSFFPWAKDDGEYSWCSLGLISILSEIPEFKKQIQENKVDPMARSWMRLPNKIETLEEALPGDIIILSRGSGLSGHVGVYLGEDFSNKKQIHLIGCNQSDSISIAAFSKSRLLGIRRLQTT